MLLDKPGQRPRRGRACVQPVHDQNRLAFNVMEALGLQVPLIKTLVGSPPGFFIGFLKGSIMRTYDKLIESIQARRKSHGHRLASGVDSSILN